MAIAATSELVVPLRKAWNITRFKRAPRAIQIIRDEVIRHLKVLPEEAVSYTHLTLPTTSFV